MTRFTNAQKYAGLGILTALILVLAPANMSAVTNALHVMHTGFVRNHTTHMWTTNLKVSNDTGASASGPIRVVITNLVQGVTVVNPDGQQNGAPYVTVSPDSLAAGATITFPVKFDNPTNGFITFTPVAYSGGN